MDKKMNARKKAQRAARLRKQRNRRIALTLCLMFVVAFASIGGTMAWLSVKTSEVTNTFTAGDIDIALTETTTNYKVIPGTEIAKDPKVTVEGGSEACWLFVKIDETNWSEYSTKLTYGIADGWTKLEDGVYYREVAANAADQDFAVLNGNKVVAADTITKAECEAMNAANPKLTFTAYAIQKEGFTTAAAAWTEAQKAPAPTTAA